MNCGATVRDGEARATQMLVGQRGMGKTSLLRRVAIGVAAEPGVAARFIPLRFREEQYNVISLDEFWRNCAESLAEWCEAHVPSDFAARVRPRGRPRLNGATRRRRERVPCRNGAGERRARCCWSTISISSSMP